MVIKAPLRGARQLAVLRAASYVGSRARRQPPRRRRHLLVVLAEAVDGRDYVVTAREMTQAERRTFAVRGGEPDGPLREDR